MDPDQQQETTSDSASRERWMAEAISLARSSMHDHGGGPFGAVIVCQDKIVGRGWNQVTRLFDPTAHAEVMATRDACRTLQRFDLAGCEIYTSCEPCPMCLYSFIGVAVTSATAIIYGHTIWDPVDVLTHFTNPVVLVVAMLALCIATLATNIAANVVSPANDFSHVAPHKISFRMGGLITGIVGIVMMPWKLVADPSGYIFTWLVGYSALLGPIGGIMIADYYVLRRRQLHLAGLYRTDSEYRYTNGFSLIAIFALVVAVLPNLPGFLATVKLVDPANVPPFFIRLYDYAWFVGFAIAFVVYLVLRTLNKKST